MIKVYFESKNHAQLVAIFDTDELYNVCLPSLEKEAKKHRMRVTESVEEEIEINQLEAIEEKN